MKTIQNIIYAAFAVIAFTSPAVRAVNPPPDGGYPNGNTAEGTQALLSLTTGRQNTALGNAALLKNTSGSQNTATGYEALRENTVGNYNTATGESALANNTGSGNTATGSDALHDNTSGEHNTANGTRALRSNTTGMNNTAIGEDALRLNTTAERNTATGVEALELNTTGHANTATGYRALASNTTGDFNTAVGGSALVGNTTGTDNIAAGILALGHNLGGSFNIGIGNDALFNNTAGQGNVAIGDGALFNGTTASGNTALGFRAGSELRGGGINNIYIGNLVTGRANDEDTIRIGEGQHATFIAGINGTTVPSGVQVVVGNDGRLGTIVSSQRFKEGIKPMDNVSEAILSLKPVTFQYKKEIDPAGTSQFGLVAEDVEKTNPDLVVRDKEGKPYSVRYDQVNAMLLNEFLKEHHKVEELTRQFQAANAQHQKQIDALTAGLQKVSAQLEASKPTPEVVNNP